MRWDGFTASTRNALFALLMLGAPLMATALDIDALWDFADPALSEQRFRAAMTTAAGDVKVELQTQVARTFSLRRRFDDAHRELDVVEAQLNTTGTAVHVRYRLERGRTFNSAGERTRARLLFEDAFERGRQAGLDGLAVDAAHMVAITHGGSDEALRWNALGLELARGSGDAKARSLIPAMLNNSAWDLHEMGRFGQALPLFEQALQAWTERQRPRQIEIARWAVARCLRSLSRFDEALAMQQALHAEITGFGRSDAYVDEELGENLLALGRGADAKPHFARAAEVLAQDASFAKREPARLARLRRLALDP